MAPILKTKEIKLGFVNSSYEEEVGKSQHILNRRESLLLDITESRKSWTVGDVENAGMYRKISVDSNRHLQISTENNGKNDSSSKRSRFMDWKWMVLAACFIAQFLSIGFAFSVSVIFVYILDEYKGTKAETSVIFSVLLGSFHMCGFLCGIFISKVGPRACGITGSFLAFLGSSVSFFATGIPFLSISLGACLGTGLSLSYISSTTCIGIYFTHTKSKLMALSFLSMGSGLGSMVFPYVLRQLCVLYGWKSCLLISGAIIAQMVPCFAVCRPKLPVNVPRHHRISKLSLSSEVSNSSSSSSRPSFHLPIEEKSTIERIKEILGNKVFCIYTLGMCVFLPAIGPFTQFFVDFFQNSKGFDEDTTILLFFILNSTSTVSRLLPGLCKQVIPGFSVLLIPVVYICFGVVAFLLFPEATTFMQHVFLVSATGLMLGGAVSAISVTTMKLVGTANYSIALGIILLIIGIGSMSSGPIAGYLRDETGTYTLGLYVSSAFLILAIFLFLSAYVLRSYGCCKSKKESNRRRRSSVIPWKNNFEYIF